MGLMRAAMITSPRHVIVDHIAIPEPGREQVLVQVEGCGVCASNQPLWEGRPWFEYPMPPGAGGHEGWGRIVAVGANVHGHAVGDRVAMLSNHAYAEFDVADADSVVRIPASLMGRPFPGEPLGCAFNVFRRSDLQPGQATAIVGIGFLGALLTRLACLAGARVIAISRRPYALRVAREMGAAETIQLENPRQVVERVRALTREEGCPRVIEAVGSQAALDLATDLTCKRGKLIIAGYHQDGPRQVNMQLWNWRGLDVVNAHERDARVYVDGMHQVLDLIVGGRLDPTPLYTHTFPLTQLADAFTTMETRPEGFLKAMVIP
jgi:2-desacetyl-2-hydroxyethyl bacteriochlorophyllide A dehydrogenase